MKLICSLCCGLVPLSTYLVGGLGSVTLFTSEDILIPDFLAGQRQMASR